MSECPYAKKCSGCQLQNLTYQQQLHMKQAKLIRLLGRYGHVKEIIGMQQPYHYRNKSQTAFGFKNGKVTAGIYQSASQKIVEVDGCLLEDEITAAIVKTIKELCAKFRIKAYDAKTGRGLLRHLLVRKGFATGQVMVALVTAAGDFPCAKQFAEELVRRHPQITTVVRNVNPTRTALFLGEDSEVLYGDGYITDTLCGLQFRISARSFYQVNPVQTEVLYSLAGEYAALSGKERVIDAYCGTGTIGLTMAHRAAQVIGVEINADAVRGAKANAKLNGIGNATFHQGDAGEWMDEMAAQGETADVFITDPPRAGCSARFLRSLLSLAPTRIVYISCNPETLARDLFTLVKGGYKVKKMQPVDLFPHTNHVETVVCLSRKDVHERIKFDVNVEELMENSN